MVRIEPYQRVEDGRGRFLGLTRESWAEVNLVTTHAGGARGNHFHAQTHEMFCVLSGTVRVEIEHVRTGARFDFDAGAGDLFVVEPFEWHTLHARTDASWLNFLSRAFDPAAPDFHAREAATAPRAHTTSEN